MPKLVLLSVADEPTAMTGFDTLLHLHAVALLTLRGIAVLEATPTGVVTVIAGPPAQVGVEQVAVSPAFPAIVATLTSGVVETSPFDDSSKQAIQALIQPGRWLIVYLASTVAEAQVLRQLEPLAAERVTVALTDDEFDRFAPAK